jgi:hypothetical protein
MTSARIIDFRHAPPNRWTSICRPDDPYKSIVREDGALLYGFFASTYQSWQFRRVIEFSMQGAPETPRATQYTESARVAVVVTTLEYRHATLELRAFGHQHGDGLRTDVVLWRLQAHDDVDEILTGLHIDAFEINRRFVGRSDAPARTIFAADAVTLPPPEAWASAMKQMVEDESQPGPGEPAFVVSPQRLFQSHTRGFLPGSGLCTELAILRGGQAIHGAVMLPLNHADTAALDEAWAQQALHDERAFWNALPVAPLPMVVPDESVMDMLIASSRNILQAREIEHGLPVFKVGPTVYRNLFVVDGHFMLETAQYLGYPHEARAAIRTLLRRVRANGAIAEMEFHTKETGISIATLIRQAELLGDDDLLRELWPTIRNGVAYIERLRVEARALPSDHPCYPLLPPAYGDGGVGGNRGEYTTAVWLLFGLKAAAQAAKRLGFADDEARFRADYDALLHDFREHAARNMRTLPDGHPYLPMWFPSSVAHHWIPDFRGEVPEWDRLRPESATWALCQAIWPGEVFAPDEPIVENLNYLHDLLDDEQGIPSSTGWLPYRSLWTYHASFAAHVWLYSGRPDKAVDYLYAFANHAAPTRVWREEQSIDSTGNGQIFGDMPHNWASVEFIRLVRHLLVFERGETLELLPGMPAAWFAPGAHTAVERTPTRFGPVSIDVRCDAGDQVEIAVAFAPEWARHPEGCVLLLPEDAWDVTVNGRAASPDAGRRLSLPFAAAVRVQARLKRTGG